MGIIIRSLKNKSHYEPKCRKKFKDLQSRILLHMGTKLGLNLATKAQPM